MAHLKLITTSLLMLMLVGCHNLPAPTAYQPEPLPNSYQALTHNDNRTDGLLELRQQNPAQLQKTLEAWWQIFADPTLDNLVQSTLTANWDLRAAAQRIEQARAQITRINAMALPAVTAEVNASRQQSGTASKLGFGLYDLYGFSANFSWEPDIFGRVAAQTRAAEAELVVETFEQRALMVASVAELVQTYAQLRTFQHLRTLTQQYEAVLQQQVLLSSQLARTGIIPDASVAAMRSELLLIQSQLPSINARIEALVSTIAVLTGGFAHELDAVLKKPGPMLAVQHPIPATLPSQLLTQRPDIAAQQARLTASLSKVQVAQADFMPQFSIPLAIGFSTTPFDLLLNPASFIWNLGAGLTAPIYMGEALEANLAIAQASNRQDQLQYEGLVRQALKEVGDAVTGYQMSLTSLQSTRNRVQEQQRIVNQQQSLYKTGQTSRLQLNQAKLHWLSAQQTLIDTRYASVVQLTMLYRALGGGWLSETPIAKNAT